MSNSPNMQYAMSSARVVVRRASQDILRPMADQFAAKNTTFAGASSSWGVQPRVHQRLRPMAASSSSSSGKPMASTDLGHIAEMGKAHPRSRVPLVHGVDSLA
jgi:hypothetical protein